MPQRTTGPFISELPATASVWHLMNRHSKLETFLRGGLYFSRIDCFSSENSEGQLADQNLGLLHSLLAPIQVPGVLEAYRLGILRAFASCWHMSNNDPSAAVWDQFAMSPEATAIRSNGHEIIANLAPIMGADGPVHYGPVRYIDHEQDLIDDTNIIHATFAIRQGYSDENEWRVLIHTHGTAATTHLRDVRGFDGNPLGQIRHGHEGKFEFMPTFNNGQGIVPEIDRRRLIQEIVIGRNASATERDAVYDLAKRYGMEDRVRV